MHMQRPYPRAVITKKGALALKKGHVWVFEGEVERIEPAPLDGTPATNGCIVDVVEENGTYQGTGLLSEESKIRIRLVSRNANDRFDDAFWRRKVQWAWDYRKTVMGRRALPGCEPDTNCCRLIFSEADGFPGLIVDRYEDVLVAQVGTVGMDRLRPVLYPMILEVLRADGQEVRGIYERNDAPARRHEGLALQKGWWDADAGATCVDAPDAQERIVMRENGIAYDVDLLNSQKTGFFLDQKYNRRAVRQLAAGKRVLDCFSHVGPFGLNAAAGDAAFVRCVDVSQTAVDLARHNAEINGLADRMGFTCADVLDYLPALAGDRKRLAAEGGPFDLVILDPPAFTKSRSTVKQARRGYLKINELALRLLPRGGYLATCSCSHFMTTSLLKGAIGEAAAAAHVQLKQVEERQQAPDHPILWGVPETHYLDFLIFQVI
ncbi:class I SAM-dependent rRNA methyltransferase [Hugonella massiliensis]|uniref:class I SAM-dependent rRNA methyltransferase n=1 Tax=Hugonella massiliensis TaxID=1720315 RepID=UPI00073FA78A|nr:class I SAM-dependent rRNA methyltransferase [Hugonella massiliensis]